MIDGIDKAKCDESGYCDYLKWALVEPLSRGISVPMVCDIHTGRTSSAKGPIYKKTNARADRGVWLNYCPFCGVSSKFWEKGEKRPLDGLATQEETANDTGG